MGQTFKHCSIAVALAGIAASGGAIAADVYPAKPIRIVIGFSPGGYIDLTSRLVAGPLSTALGQQVVVDDEAARAASSAPKWPHARRPMAIR